MAYKYRQIQYDEYHIFFLYVSLYDVYKTYDIYLEAL